MMKKIFWILVVVFFAFIKADTTQAAGNNLIANPSVETPSSDSTIPQDWYQDAFGRNRRTFSYPVGGQEGQKAVKVEIQSWTGGDAKWTFNDVPVTPGATYSFSDYYQSNIPSYWVIRYTNNNNVYKYLDLAALNPASDWTQNTASFKVPANMKSVTVYHLIKGVGWLTTDNSSLVLTGGSGSITPTPTPSTGPGSPTPTDIIDSPTPTPSTGSESPTPIVDTPSPTPTEVINSPTPTPSIGSGSPTPIVNSPTPTSGPSSPTPTSSPNNGGLILNGSLENSASGNSPDNWAKGGWGTNTASLTYPVAGFDGARAAKVEISQFTSGDAKWYFDDVTVTPSTSYTFSDSYQSTIGSTLIIRYTSTNNALSYVNLATLPASPNWTTISKTFTVPANTKSLTIFHVIAGVGSLTTDKFSLTQAPPPPSFAKGMVSLDFDDGWTSTYENGLPILNAAGYKSTQYIITQYMDNAPGYVTTAQINQMKAQGHDIEAHSQTHADLITLSQAQMQQEVCGSRQDLINIGITPIAFAYPYGNWNQNVINAVKTCGYGGARTATYEDGGFNAIDQNPYLLKTLSVESGTSLADIQTAIDTAANTKTWLILVFHSVASDGSQYDTPPAKLQSVVNYLKTSNVDVVTVRGGLARLGQ